MSTVRDIRFAVDPRSLHLGRFVEACIQECTLRAQLKAARRQLREVRRRKLAASHAIDALTHREHSR